MSDRAALECHQRDRLRAMLHDILPGNRFYAAKFAGCDLDCFDSLPFTTKSELVADQAAVPPYGTALTYPIERYTRLHQTSGTTTGQPLRWLDTPESWQWMLECWRTKFAVMGATQADRFCFAFAYGPFIGFWTGHEAALAQGSFVLAVGGMSSAVRLRVILDHGITIVGCTPTYALRLAEVAREEKIDLPNSAVRLVVVAGEPGGSVPAIRNAIAEGWGARVIDHYGLTETGPLAVECADDPGSMIFLESEVIVEVIDPETTAPVSAGTTGELVVTNLGRLGSPLIRYRTGDLVRMESDSGRFTGGILGRTDDMIHIRGNNLYPSAIDAVIRAVGGVAEYRVEVDRSKPTAALRIAIEPTNGTPAAPLTERLVRAIRDELMVRADISIAPSGSLPRFEMKARRFVHQN